MTQATALRPTSPNHHRFHLLDAMRGLAAGFVIIVHAPAYISSRLGAHNAFLAVDFFFCLSGFVIAFSYERRLAGGLGLSIFFKSRVIRLYPVYLLAAVLGLLLLLTIDSHTAAMASGTRRSLVAMGLLLVPNFNASVSPFLFPLDMPAWSLFFEIIANLGYALLVRKHGATNLIISLIAVSSLSLLIRWIVSGRQLGEIGWQSSLSLLYLGLARVVASFASGVLMLRVYRARSQPRWLAYRRYALPFAVILMLLFLLQSPFATMQSNAFQLLCTSLFFPALVLLGAYCRPAEFFTPSCIVLGEISYPMYLLHMFFLRPLGFRHFTRFGLAHPIASQCAFAATIIVTATVSYFVAQRYDAPLRQFLMSRNSTSFAIQQQSVRS